MIITCPHCQTRYQVADQTIPTAGRQVLCAHCNMSWRATLQDAEAEAKAGAITMNAGGSSPPREAMNTTGTRIVSDTLFDAAHEQELDEKFEAEERSVVSERATPRTLGKVDLALVRKRRAALMRRQRELTRKRPSANLRRTVRIASVAFLVVAAGGGIWLRTPLVEVFPALAGLYAGVGLPVNIVGLDIADAKTLSARSSGKSFLQITATIVNVAGRTVDVPPVRVNLLSASGKSVYAWRVVPRQRTLASGESMQFTTDLVSPPAAAARVRLDFVTYDAAPRTSDGASVALTPGE